MASLPLSYLVIPSVKLTRFIAHMLDDVPQVEWPHAVIFDLEDSVPPHRKAEARDLLADALDGRGSEIRARARVLIKVNAATTEHFQDDLEFVRHLRGLQIGVATAKNEHPSELDPVFDVCERDATGERFVLPAIETLAGLDNINAILAHAGRSGVRHVAFGAADMSASLQVDRDFSTDMRRFVFCQLVLAGRRSDVGVVDAPPWVLPSTRDQTYFREAVSSECEWARRNGAAGKLAIHPAQVPIVNGIFDPEEREGEARSLIRQFEEVEDLRSLVSEDTGEYVGSPEFRAALERTRR